MSCGGDLVYLAEELYLRLFVLTMLLMIVGCGLSIFVAELARNRTHIVLTLVFATAGLVVAVGGLIWPRATYRWLRYSTPRELALAGLAVAMVLINGPDSPSWWVALPLLWVIATVSSTARTVAASVATALAYLTGTMLGGEPLIEHGSPLILTSAVALSANTLLGRLIVEAFARFVLRMRTLEDTVAQPPPLRVANLAPSRARPASSHPHNQGRGPQRDRTSRLTARQLEVALLTRDGLRHAEIAVCLGISPRQVERLLRHARERVGAANASELVAMLVTGRLTPPIDRTPLDQTPVWSG